MAGTADSTTGFVGTVERVAHVTRMHDWMLRIGDVRGALEQRGGTSSLRLGVRE